MILLGTIVNTAAILAGGTAGLLLKKLLPRRITDAIMQGLGLAVIIVGLSGALSSAFTVAENGAVSSRYTLLMIISLAAGAFAGEVIGVEARIDMLAKKCEEKFAPKNSQNLQNSPPSTFAQGFVTATLIFCVGSMAIVGALEDGLNNNPDILFAKSALDCITGMIFASTLGAGVLFSAVAVAAYQGGLTLLAIFVAPYLNDEVVAQTSFIGSVLIMAIGFNMLKIAKIKVGNLLPAVFIPVIYYAALYILQRQ